MPNKYILYGSKGTGSAIVEAILEFSGLPYQYVDIPYEKILAKDPEFLKINPLSRVPALKLPNDEILTESGAMAVYIAMNSKKKSLIPDPSSPSFAAFWRYLFIINGEIYPTFTFGDDPSEWVTGKLHVEELRRSTDKFREELWMNFETSLSFKPWAMGKDLTVIDFYIGVMTHWRPRIDWFKENCPRLYKLSSGVHQIKECRDVFAKNF